jgi:hypothetical protein
MLIITLEAIYGLSSDGGSSDFTGVGQSNIVIKLPLCRHMWIQGTAPPSLLTSALDKGEQNLVYTSCCNIIHKMKCNRTTNSNSILVII